MSRTATRPILRLTLLALSLACAGHALALPSPLPAGPAAVDTRELGYFRQAAAGPDNIVFAADGELWSVPYSGGQARRLTSRPAEAASPAVSPDGRWLAFVARYDGSPEVYVMPAEGGATRRLTVDGDRGIKVEGWSRDGQVLVSSSRYSGKPDTRLFLISPQTGVRSPVPLAEAAEACLDARGNPTLFAREPVPSDNVVGYVGGKRQQLWSWQPGREARPAFPGHPGTSRQPMCDGDTAYFISDKGGRLNLWQGRLGADGVIADSRPLTRYQDFEVRGASLARTAAGVRIVFTRAGDIHVFDPQTGSDNTLKIALNSDFDQLRAKMIANPLSYVEDLALSPKGDRVAVQARGYVSIFPVGSGRRVDILTDAGQRARNLVFSADGKSLLLVSDKSGEQEIWRVGTRGGETAQQLTHGGASPIDQLNASPDGRKLAYTDNLRRLWLLDLNTREKRLVRQLDQGGYDGFQWSPDSRFFTYTADAVNDFSRLWLYDTLSHQSQPLASDRYTARSPVFSPDGKVLYFLSDRNLDSEVRSPWGAREPSAYFNKQTKIYGLMLSAAERWPFQPKDELAGKTDEAAKDKAEDGDKDKAGGKDKGPKPVKIEGGVSHRLYEVPLEPGNYDGLQADAKRLYFTRADNIYAETRQVVSLEIDAPNPTPSKPETLVDGVREFRLSADRKSLLLVKDVNRLPSLMVVPAGPKMPGDADKYSINLRDWALPLDPRVEWKQIFLDTWRMHRDTVHTATLKEVDWEAIRRRFEPLVDKVTSRQELNDVIAQMTAMVGIQHSQIGLREVTLPTVDVPVGQLAADFQPVAGGLKVAAIWNGDPELLEERSPLSLPEAGIRVGDVVHEINGQPLVSEYALASALRGQAGKQVLLKVSRGGAAARTVIVKPVSLSRDRDLRYLAWEGQRKAMVEKASRNRIGYLHLQAMGKDDAGRWAREYYPVFDREGLILDLRDNNGGNIDRWLLEKLLRKVWVWWQGGNEKVTMANPPYAFRGKVVALIDGDTYSDGETFALGLKQLGIATLIGKTTAGAGMWLSDQNWSRDKGIARAARMPQFVVGKNGDKRWVVEGRGVTPDIEVDNLPWASFKGQDAQLEAAIRYLQQGLPAQPASNPQPPAGGAQGSRFRGF
ncbi:S41 family peptidase [Chromobacterium sp. IIBBL 290-4]|uniref:S41 family peptidase n=1 Tax=Chromobacterium sp. IIBBL 290-4 TaxID=2953890 RepID=UPI0020B68411|nr:S41 family peptidase [Chromobacterium sp. IIBBL 290-4]UTH74401.1 S41 family peptidase [Chromobacterium sp. IIBBL 290-4]